MEAKVTEGFEAVMKSIENKEAAETARNFKTKVRLLSFAYHSLIRNLVQNAEGVDRKFSSFAMESAAKAELRAEEMYAWLEGFIPDSSQSWLNMGKQDKMSLMPYIVAYAYAVRVMIDARLVMGHNIECEAAQRAHIDECRQIISKFMRVLRAAVMAIVSGTSLLEIAVDYNLPLAAYVMLITSMQASEQALIEPHTMALGRVQAWDDGLSEIR